MGGQGDVGEDRVDDYALVGILAGVNGDKLASVANNQEISREAMASPAGARSA